MKTIYINNEECRFADIHKNIMVSESGRVYRVKPIGEYEEALKEQDPNLLYFHEYSTHINNNKFVVGYGSNKETIIHNLPYLVAKAWNLLPENLEYYKISFKDGNFRNNHYTNIEYVKRSDNKILTKEDIKIIQSKIKEGKQLRQIAREHHTSEMHVQRIKSGAKFGIKKEPYYFPFYIKDGRIEKLLRQFIYSKSPLKDTEFKLYRNPFDSEDNMLIGTIKGYQFCKKSKNVTNTIDQMFRLNSYFNLKQ